jgi:hypothetical protein
VIVSVLPKSAAARAAITQAAPAPPEPPWLLSAAPAPPPPQQKTITVVTPAGFVQVNVPVVSYLVKVELIALPQSSDVPVVISALFAFPPWLGSSAAIAAAAVI